MKFSQISALVLTWMIAAAMPPGYRRKPFRDQFHKSGPQVIPGAVQLALYDLGGEGLAYHDTDVINQGSKLNHTEFRRDGPTGELVKHCRLGTGEYTCFFRENEGVDISYTKDFADFSHPNLFDPPKTLRRLGRRGRMD